MRDKEELLGIARSFIGIQGHQQCGCFEREIAGAVRDLMLREGIECELSEIAPNRFNVRAELKGSGGGKRLVLNTHLDTVPAYQMPDPFTAKEEDGLLFGRGAADVRSGLACLCYTLIAIKRSGRRLQGDLILLATCDEESGSLGARTALPELDADFAIVCEPTDLDVGIAHKGVEWFGVDFEGIATHAGAPENGENAIYKAAAFIEALKRYMDEEMDRSRHPLIGRSTLNVGVIEGGDKPTIVPDRCRVCFDARWLPDKKRSDIIRELKQILMDPALGCGGRPPELKLMLGSPDKEFPAMEIPENHHLAQTLCGISGRIREKELRPVGLHFWTEAALFQNIAHIPSVVIGPGSIKQAHSNCEYVPVNEVYDAWRIYTGAAIAICGEM